MQTTLRMCVVLCVATASQAFAEEAPATGPASTEGIAESQSPAVTDAKSSSPFHLEGVFDAYFSSEEFHAAVQGRGSLALSFADFLERLVAERGIAEPQLGDVIRLERMLARCRRDLDRAAPGGSAPSRSTTRRRTSSTPCTWIPKLSLATVSRAFGALGTVASSATWVVFRRWSSLFTIWLGGSFPEPSAR